MTALSILVAFVLLQGAVFMILLTQVRTASAELDAANSMTTEINGIEMQHYKWLQGLTLTVFAGEEFTGSLDSTTCSLGSWLASDEVQNNTDPDFQALISQLPEPHDAIHSAAR